MAIHRETVSRKGSPGLATSWSPSPTPSARLLQRRCACGTHAAGGECPECAKKRGLIRRKAIADVNTTEIPPIVQEVLHSPGQSLDAETRAFMEPRFGRDLVHVRVHADAKAAESARAVCALAYTVGHDVVFAQNRYAPTTHTGRELLAHELAHTIQQRGASSKEQPTLPGAMLEARAEQAGWDAASGRAVVGLLGRSKIAVARQVDEDLDRVPDELTAGEREEFLRYRSYRASFPNERSEIADERFAQLVEYARRRSASRAASRAAAEAAVGRASGAAPMGEEDEPAPVPMALPKPGSKKQRPRRLPARPLPAPRREPAAKGRFLPGGFTDDETQRVLAESRDEVWQAIQAREREEAKKARQEDEGGDDPYVWGYVPSEYGTSERVRMRRSELEAAQDRARNRPILETMGSISSAGPVTTAGLVVGGTARVIRGGESQEAVPSALAFGSLGDPLAGTVGAVPLQGFSGDPGRPAGAIVEQAPPRERAGEWDAPASDFFYGRPTGEYRPLPEPESRAETQPDRPPAPAVQVTGPLAGSVRRPLDLSKPFQVEPAIGSPAPIPAVGTTRRPRRNVQPPPITAAPKSRPQPIGELLGNGPEARAVNPTTPGRTGRSREPLHHVFPQQYRGWFEARGFTGPRDIDNFCVQEGVGAHEAVHGGGSKALVDWTGPKVGVARIGVGGRIGVAVDWNTQVMVELTGAEDIKGSGLTFDEIKTRVETLMEKYKIERQYFPFRR